MSVEYFDQLLGAVRQVHVVYLAQLLGAVLFTHFLSYHDKTIFVQISLNFIRKVSNKNVHGFQEDMVADMADMEVDTEADMVDTAADMEDTEADMEDTVVDMADTVDTDTTVNLRQTRYIQQQPD